MADNISTRLVEPRDLLSRTRKIVDGIWMAAHSIEEPNAAKVITELADTALERIDAIEKMLATVAAGAAA